MCKICKMTKKKILLHPNYFNEISYIPHLFMRIFMRIFIFENFLCKKYFLNVVLCLNLIYELTNELIINALQLNSY